MESTSLVQPRWLRIAITACAGFFMFALFIAAAFQPSIRLLHVLQAIIYVAVIALTRRNSAWGFGAGCFIGAFWLYISIRDAAQPLWLLLTGRLFRADLALELLATLAHLCLLVACVAGFWRLARVPRSWLPFLAGGSLTIAYFLLIVFATAPPYSVYLVRKALGI